MLCFPRVSASCEARYVTSTLAVLGLYLLLIAPSVYAQAVPGFQAPEKPKSAEVSVQAKAARGEAPLSNLYSHLGVDPSKIRRLPALGARELRKEMSRKILRIGVVRSLGRPLNPMTDGPFYRLVEGEVRVMGVVSEGALYTRVRFTGMSLPAGARVFVYSMKNPDDFYGPYEGHGDSEDGTFWTPPMKGDGVVVEYFTPNSPTTTAEVPFNVSDVSHVFKDAVDIEAAGLCNLEVPAEWATVAKSVGRVQFVSGIFEGLCTGTLLNDEIPGGEIPYFLSANHCIGTQTEAQSARVHWFYDSGDDPPPGTPFTDGANLLVTGTASDFTFMRLTGALPGGLVFSGWSANPVPLSTSVSGIHHPEGSHKRISFGSTNSNCAGGLPGPCANFTHVGWSSGTTEAGSSGSGLWIGPAASAQLVGTLTGGAASCTPPSGTDDYGSFSVTYPSISSFLNGTDCVSSISPTNQSFSNFSQSGTLNVIAPGGCNWTASSTASFITITSGASGNGGGTVNFSVAANNGEQRSGSIVIGQRVFNVTQAPGGGCVPSPIIVGQTVNGSLNGGSCPLGDGTTYQPFRFSGLAGQQISILMTSNDFDAFLFLVGPDGFILATDDDGGGGLNSRIPPGSGRLTLPADGTYIILANSISPVIQGQFSLTLEGPPLADLAVSTIAANNRVVPGSKVVYLITVTNNNGTTASSITVTDNLPAGLTFSSCGAADGVCGGSGNNRTITFPSLAAGASATAVLSATVDNSAAVDTVISNTATVGASTPDPHSANNASTATVTVRSTQFPSRANGRIATKSDRQFTGSTQPSGIYGINPDGTSEALLIGNTRPIASPPSWSPDGTKIAYGRIGGPPPFEDEIYVANADGTGSLMIAGNAFNRNSRIAWSPNGAKLAFIGTGGLVHIVNADGTGLTKLPVSPASINDLSWSPDGSMFAYSNNVDVFVMNVDGSGQMNLTQGRTMIGLELARNLLPRWSPNGTKLIFSAEASNQKHVYVINPDGTGLAPLVTLHQSMQPTWSPDGSKISFIVLNELYVANADGSAPMALTNNHFYNLMPDWQSLDVPPPAVQLSASAYPATEGTAGVSVVVTRTGDTSGASSVNYATTDTSGANNCNFNNGAASSRCDYLTTIGTLHFLASEMSKSITIPIIDDSFAEGSESFTFTVSNPTGATLGSPVSATITIADNETINGVNPIDASGFFVRQHYIDFLNREPDPAGFSFWTGEIENCTPKPQCTETKRINVSAAFFLSIEFQQTGYLVERLYKSSYGDAVGT
ncbi:MAG: DPP IV N-terminal domain-containing protein, partial [Pyrinomonadaceae bacterium]|nr:DPP IV N-terminal domain-containing protein [Pyrinomonadaceae bacterium]